MVTRAYVLKRLEAEVKRLRYGCGNHDDFSVLLSMPDSLR